MADSVGVFATGLTVGSRRLFFHCNTMHQSFPNNSQTHMPDAALTTGGGTSDARFIKDFCPVAELGLKNDTAHKVDEFAAVAEIEQLADIYTGVLSRYFSQS